MYRKIAISITSSLASRLVTLIAPFLVMPAMLDYLGPKGFSIWVTSISIINMAAFMDFGVGNSLLTRLSAYYGRSDFVSARRDIGASYVILFAVFLAGLGCVAVFFGAIYPSLCDCSPIADSDHVIILVMLLFFISGLPLTVIYRVVYANQKIWLYSIMQISSAIISVIMILVAMELSAPIWVVVSIFSGSPVAISFVASILYYRKQPNYRPRRQDLAFGEDGLALLRLGLGHLCLGIIIAVSMNIDMTLILSKLGSEAVANFAMPARIGSLLHIMVGLVFLPLWSFNGAAIARHDYKWVMRSSMWMSFLGGLSVAVFGLILTLNIDQIMQIWSGRSFADQNLVVGSASIFATVIAIVAPWNMVLNAAGKVKVQIWAWGGFLAVSVFGKFVLVSTYGSWVVSLVSAFAYLICIAPLTIGSALRFIRQT